MGRTAKIRHRRRRRQEKRAWKAGEVRTTVKVKPLPAAPVSVPAVKKPSRLKQLFSRKKTP